MPANALIALAAAASWGGGDFSGGMGVKAAAADAGDATRGALRMVIVAHAASLAALLLILIATHAPWPVGVPMAWSLAAGVLGAIALTAFYMALARGEMGSSAALCGLLAAAVPVAFGMLREGSPRPLTLVGFVLAGGAIWIIAAGPSPENAGPETARSESAGHAPNGAKGTRALAVVGGLGLGAYFVALKLASPLGAMEPMALARAASLATCTVLLWLATIAHKRSPRGPGATLAGEPRHAAWLGRQALVWAMGVALLDTGGNLLFIAAARLGRLDVAAVLASLYPAGTILLAAWRLHERPTRRQLAGMAVALAAVAMITV